MAGALTAIGSSMPGFEIMSRCRRGVEYLMQRRRTAFLRNVLYLLLAREYYTFSEAYDLIEQEIIG